MDKMLVVFYKNILEIAFSFVVGREISIFVGQILNSIIIIILGRRE